MKRLEKYVFRRYSEKFPVLFAYVKRRLREILPLTTIEHIGSSAVPGLGGKGIVDVMVAVPKRSVAGALKKLVANGYEYTGRGGSRDRKFLMRTVRSGGRERQVHIHLTHSGSRVGRAAVVVRDYLRQDRAAAMEYAKLKRLAVKKAGGDGKKYRQFKKAFLDKIERKALGSSAAHELRTD